MWKNSVLRNTALKKAILCFCPPDKLIPFSSTTVSNPFGKSLRKTFSSHILGSGKSTLMNIMGLLDNFTAGEYIIDNINVKGLNDNQLSEIRNKTSYILAVCNDNYCFSSLI